MTAHPKLFLFDVGVYRTIWPTGPVDRTSPRLPAFALLSLARITNSPAFRIRIRGLICLR